MGESKNQKKALLCMQFYVFCLHVVVSFYWKGETIEGVGELFMDHASLRFLFIVSVRITILDSIFIVFVCAFLTIPQHLFLSNQHILHPSTNRFPCPHRFPSNN